MVSAGEWFSYYIKEDDKHVTLKIDGNTVLEHTEPEDLEDMLGRGTVALQATDSKGATHFQNVLIRLWPDDE